MKKKQKLKNLGPTSFLIFINGLSNVIISQLVIFILMMQLHIPVLTISLTGLTK